MASILNVDVRKGMVILMDDQLYYVLDRELRTPGNLPSKLKLKVKNLKSGLVNEVRVHPEDKVEQAFLDRRPMEYSYKDGDDYVFMDKESYEQVPLKREMVEDLMGYLKENDTVQVTFYQELPISIELPQTVTLKIVETDPSLKGATAAAQYKPAKLETGITVQIPPHLATGDIVIIGTEDGKYMGRAKE